MSTRYKIVVSDTHLSAGPPTGANPLEDFTSDRAFAALLGDAAAESQARGAEVELILNGDAFDFLQVPHLDTFDPARRYPPTLYHGTTEGESVQKIALVIAGHPLFFDALRRFLHPGPPRRSATFVSGNHDLNLYWPAVQARLRHALDAVGAREPLLTFEPHVARRDGLHVEHGNQYGEFVNRVPDMDNPVDPENPDRLVVPPGSWFVMDFFNDVERERYWVDGVKPVTALIFYALAYDFPFAARALALLLRRLPGIVIGGAGALEAEARGDEGVQALLDGVDDPEAVDALAARYEQDPAFRAAFNATVERVISPPVGDRPLALRVAPQPDPVAVGERARRDVHSSLYDAAARIAADEGVAVVTFGHTHEPGLEALPNGATYANTGTWTWQGDFGQAGPHTWRELFEHPERFAGDRDLTYVRVDYDEAGRPAARVLRQAASTPPPAEGGQGLLRSLGALLVTWLRVVWARITGK